MHAFISGVAIWGPGLPGWDASLPVLAGRQAYVAEATPPPPPSILPPTERRRAGVTVRLALTVAQQAMAMAGETAGGVRSVFGSGNGDGAVVHAILEELAKPDPQVSPTQFHNSVHNAAAGYWSIAAAATAAANVLCAFDASFGAGLLEGLTQVAVERIPVLLLAYDTQYPEPLHAKRPIPDAFGAAFVLAPDACRASLAKVTAVITASGGERMREAQLEELRGSIPAARSLPLLAKLARRESGRVTLDYLPHTQLALEVHPCS